MGFSQQVCTDGSLEEARLLRLKIKWATTYYFEEIIPIFNVIKSK